MRARSTRTRSFAVAFAAAAPLLFAAPAQASELKAGLEFRAEAAMADIGLPVYPGAVAVPDRDDDKGALTLGLWGGSFGFQLQLRKFTSTDDIDAVAAFYRKALARHGAVLDCSEAPARPAKAGKNEDKSLSCSKVERQPGKRVYKVGADNRNFRLVSLEAGEAGVQFHVMRIAVKGD